MSSDIFKQTAPVTLDEVPVSRSKRGWRVSAIVAVCIFAVLALLTTGYLALRAVVLPSAGAVPVEDFNCPLVRGYELFSVKGDRFLIIGPNDPLYGQRTIVPPDGGGGMQVNRVGIWQNRWIVGTTARPLTGDGSLYFIIDTTTGQVQTGMSDSEYARWCEATGTPSNMTLHYSFQCYNGIPR